MKSWVLYWIPSAKNPFLASNVLCLPFHFIQSQAFFLPQTRLPRMSPPGMRGGKARRVSPAGGQGA
jgi:hypothetical protein